MYYKVFVGHCPKINALFLQLPIILSETTMQLPLILNKVYKFRVADELLPLSGVFIERQPSYELDGTICGETLLFYVKDKQM